MSWVPRISSYTNADMKRRTFLKRAVSVPALGATASLTAQTNANSSLPQSKPEERLGHYNPGRIPNEFNLLLPGEREALRNSPRVKSIDERSVTASLNSETKTLKTGEAIGGWQLVAVLPWLNGVSTAVF